MILEFSVRNFRSYNKKQTLSFEATSDETLEDFFCYKVSPKVRLLKLGVIYGANASGKSNLLSALAYLKRIATNPRERDDKTFFKPFIFNEESQKSPGEFDIFFYYKQIKYHYFVKIGRNNVYEEKLEYYPKAQPVEVFSRRKQEISFGSHQTVKLAKKFRDALETNTMNSMTLISALKKTNVDCDIYNNVLDWFSFKLLPNISSRTNLKNWTTDKFDDNDGCRNLILELIKKADFNVNNIKLQKDKIPIDNEIREDILQLKNIPDKVKEQILEQGEIEGRELLFFHKISHDGADKYMPLDYEEESAGTKRYYGLGGPLSEAMINSRILIIDELESSLHPDLLNHFIRTFLVNSTDSQLIFTTHNLSVIAEPDEIRRDVIWFTEKDRMGQTELYSLSDFRTSDIRKGMSYLNAYKAGKFGAIPNLGEIYLNNGEDNGEENK